jgi:hypothetical protein
MSKMGSHDPFEHLNTSYGQKKGQESNWQFDSQPLKVKNHPNFLRCRWHAMYHWKALDEGYNFASNFISIKGLHTKLWAQSCGSPNFGNFETPTWDLGTKWHLGAAPIAKHKVYYKAEGGGFPQVRAMVSLVSLCLLMVRSCTKVFQLHTNQLVVWFVQVRVNNWISCHLPSPILELQHTPLPPKCCEPRSAP